jgi:hypothetical protein
MFSKKNYHKLIKKSNFARSECIRKNFFGSIRLFMILLEQQKNQIVFYTCIYWLGKLAIEEIVDNNKRTITFSPILRERLGHHIHGEIWATKSNNVLKENKFIRRPIHIISANMHSVMNSIFATHV